MNKREFYYPSADGKTTIHAVEWTPSNVRHYKGIIQIAHGLSEHIMLYEPIAEYFTDRGFIVRGNDHLGHGQSVLPGEPRLYLGPKGSWHFASDDIYTCRLLTEKEYGELPYIILGFSLGSYLVRDYLIRYGDSVDAAILVGCLSFPKPATFFGKIIANVLSLVLGEKAAPKILDFFVNETNNLQIKNRRGYLDWINENEDEVKRLIADPYAMETISIGLFRELLYAIKFTGKIENIAKMNKDNPIIFISGKDDPVARGGKTISDLVKKFKQVGIKDVSYKLYDGRHRVLFEKTGPMTLDKIYDWACSKLKTEDIESMEKANPKLSNALKSMIILAKEGVKEAGLLSGDLFSELNVEKTVGDDILSARVGASNDTVGASTASPNDDYKNRFDEVTNKIDDLVKNKKIDLVIDIGAGFAVRGLVCKNKNIDYIGVDLPAVISEAKEMHSQIEGLKETKFKAADITNYESLKNIVSENKGKILILTENIEEDLFDFELKFARENIKRLIHDYDVIYLKSEKSGVELIEKNDVAELDKIRTSTQFNLSHLSSDEDVIVRVEGALDSITSSKLIDYVEGLSVDLQNRNLIINLSKVDYIMPAGLNVLEKIESKYNNVELIFKKV
ncbi:MAG: alpha/beta fold hydrolase [Lachnospiraceae bacterium]|nr:alpha/beta fold hydrolase [Lachnospiraceae bacterium]